MKIGGVVAAAALVAAGIGTAQAQTAACTQLRQVIASKPAQVKAMQGAVQKEETEAITYASKLQLIGYSGCTLTSNKEQDKFSKYFQHHLYCSSEKPTSDAAIQAVEEIWACVKDGFTEREATEAFIGGSYRIVGIDGDTPTAGRASGIVSFGTTEHARLWVEKNYPLSDEYDVHIYWMFKS